MCVHISYVHCACACMYGIRVRVRNFSCSEWEGSAYVLYETSSQRLVPPFLQSLDHSLYSPHEQQASHPLPQDAVEECTVIPTV